MYSVANILNGMVESTDSYIVLRFISGFGLAGELGAGITLVSESMKKYAPKDQKRTPQEWKDAKESFKVPSKDVLKNLVGEDFSNMNKQQLETQQLMLFEFLKYGHRIAKLSSTRVSA
jgi:hypothetical protein